MATELASVPDALKQCQRCQSLVLEWPITPTLEPVDRKYIKYLGLQSSWSETCGTCQTFRTVIRNVAIDESAYLVPTLVSFDFLISSPTTKEVKGWQVKGQKWVDKNQTINNCDSNHEVIGTILEHPNPDFLSFVNIPNIRQWIDRCKNTKNPNHRYCNRPLARPPRNLRVIDCQQRAIIPKPEGASYIALSYVWGKVAANPLEFNQAQAFGQDEISTGDGRVQDSDSHHPLPQLILDSMKVTLDLGYRYLWIDRYCIDQSNSLEKHAQIEQMDLVYTGAVATIIAAEGQDPNDGLPGVSIPRQPTRSFKIGQTSCYVSSKLDHEFDKRKWGTRAWTYQEGELPSRRLVFFNDSVYVECRKSAAFESPRAVPVFSSIFNSYDIPDSDRGALNCIWEHIEAYSSRSLSYPEDIVNAITGIFKFRSQISPRLYTFSGLPALEPDPTTCLSSLMWFNHCPPNTVNLSQRRQGYPSWSWLGITGSIMSPNTRSMQNPEYYMCTKIQAILEDGTTTAPGTSVRTSSKSGRSMLRIQELVARGVCIEDLQFQLQPSVDGQTKWEVQFLPGHKFPFDFLFIRFVPDLNDADMGTGKNFKALLLFFYDSGRAMSPNKGALAEPNGYELQLLVLNQRTTKKTGAWERVGMIRLFAYVPDKSRTKEGTFWRLEQSGCVRREQMVLV